MTVDSRVPKNDCSSVLMPVTNSSVCTTLTLSPCNPSEMASREQHQTLLELKLVTAGANPWRMARIKKRRGALTSLPPIMGTSTAGIMTAVPSARM